MTIAHFVSFKLKTSIANDAEAKNAVKVDMLALKTSCSKEGAPYILDLVGGAQVSTEGHDKGFDLGFVVTFATPSDRDYYLDGCPSHKAFAEDIKQKIDDVFVYDFEY